jgi:hypothetical protein
MAHHVEARKHQRIGALRHIFGFSSAILMIRRIAG